MNKVLRTLWDWARLIFELPSRRPIRVGPGLWLSVPWGTTDREIATALRSAIAEWDKRKRGKK